MEKVIGIGGIFIKAKDPEALGQWYSRHLGIELKDGCANFPWQAGGQPIRDGRTVWHCSRPTQTIFLDRP